MGKVKYYWLCSYILEPGSTVLPGNWGRIVKLYTTQNNAYIYLREEIFERIRRENYPHLPSRMTSIFICEDLSTAKDFKRQSGRTFDILYEVELIDDKPVFTADWALLNFLPEPLPLAAFEERANLYWKAENVINKEILTESRIKIVRRID